MDQGTTQLIQQLQSKAVYWEERFAELGGYSPDPLKVKAATTRLAAEMKELLSTDVPNADWEEVIKEFVIHEVGDSNVPVGQH